MEAFAPFRPAANLFAMAAVPTGSPSATLLGSGLSGDVTVMLHNDGPNDVVVGFGPTSTAAVANAVVPLLSGGPQNVVILKGIAGGWRHGFTQNGQFIFAACVSVIGSCTVYGQCGYGFSGA